MPQLMGPRTGAGRPHRQRASQLGSGGGRRPSATAGRSVNHAEQRSGRQRDAVGQPGGKLFEPELVHPGLAALIALSVSDEQRPTPVVDVGLVERQRFGDPQPTAPQDSDQRPDTKTVSVLAGNPATTPPAQIAAATAPRSPRSQSIELTGAVLSPCATGPLTISPLKKSRPKSLDFLTEKFPGFGR
jgi:hypothetical protein